MGHIVRAQRRGNGSVFQAHTHHRVGPAKFRALDAAERTSVISGMVKEIIHDPGRGAPLAKLIYKKAEGQGFDSALVIAPEGIHTGQFIKCGAQADLHIGNILPLAQIPEGTEICNVEHRPGDGGRYGRCSGDSCRVIGHTENYTRIQLPSGRKALVSNICRATLGIVAGGGRPEKPLLKAGNVHYKYKAKRHTWPVVCGIKMNPVDHRHGGGSHQHMGAPGTVARSARPGQKLGLIASRRTGRRRGTVNLA
ncbi:ribosomal protein L8, putative [Trichomonas vaginalis G3]|uniref:Ribosomal protein L8, putative n=1 Tax=Trichomonas vaginalis (strain ATCC PRA-98 / G3) TaxID=412133 RepID=A2E6Z8_TRIV3|nr:ribosomal protein L8 [Trichomonas vaginalis G3]XP_001312498.1 ribosomal protein L8 [Trichomonas vaginalis G3]XP_001320771.1 50S ribosomal protein L2 [Trichomonas vaginalis G3]XP_001323739.1 ribosomal protein L8 [Trichomonas vaginalis G3]XP_051106433.1 ribosomal protein L8 [Trichomonas vaginalis G3]5XY3_A Chain A, Ribosomal protein L8, putative [Trichomonas vaginalis]EAX90066.1 ribosomal protein L8, putative [Trichomonas vaginalis G3]EAX99568.1 ribosomal protein L8, putative [Trichomonas v|eukprot:XP_001302996.1 ribosomal protein L8 [Trichomonas vaginalis G3]